MEAQAYEKPAFVVEAEEQRGRESDPLTWTPALLRQRGADIWVSCEPCQTSRIVPLGALIDAGRGEQPVHQMRFKCQDCDARGEMKVAWLSERGQQCFHNFTTGETKGNWRGPFAVIVGIGYGAQRLVDGVIRPPRKKRDPRT